MSLCQINRNIFILKGKLFQSGYPPEETSVLYVTYTEDLPSYYQALRNTQKKN